MALGSRAISFREIPRADAMPRSDIDSAPRLNSLMPIFTSFYTSEPFSSIGTSSSILMNDAFL